MSLMKSLNSGVSGLRAFQNKMDVIGNNISNVDTPGFKASNVSFENMLSQSIGSGGGSASAPTNSAQVGLGVQIASIEKDFSNGSFQTTGKKTDLGIKGNGFFVVSNGQQNYLTRAGNFAFNKDGYLVTQNGDKVQGFNANKNGKISTSGTTNDIHLDFSKVLQPKATSNVNVAGNLNANTSKTQVSQAQLAFTTKSGSVASGSTKLNNLSQTSTNLVTGDKINFNVTLNNGTSKTLTYNYNSGDTLNNMLSSLNSQLGSSQGTFSLVDGLMVLRSANPGGSQLNVNSTSVSGTGSINIPSFQVTQQGQTNSHSISSTVYDNLGQAHKLVLKLTQTNNNTWNYKANFLNGEKITSGGTGTINFDKTGSLSSSNTLNLSFNPGNGAKSQTFNINLGNPTSGSQLTQFAGSNSAKVTSQDGYKQGELTDYSIDGDGNINGKFSNGRTKKLAQIAIGTVSNKDGLDSKGNNLYSRTEKSGAINTKTASELSSTSLKSGVLEGSNVDLARQFTNMISTQRAYQANARVITTSDKLSQQVVNLVR